MCACALYVLYPANIACRNSRRPYWIVHLFVVNGVPLIINVTLSGISVNLQAYICICVVYGRTRVCVCVCVCVCVYVCLIVEVMCEQLYIESWPNRRITVRLSTFDVQMFFQHCMVKYSDLRDYCLLDTAAVVFIIVFVSVIFDITCLLHTNTCTPAFST